MIDHLLLNHSLSAEQLLKKSLKAGVPGVNASYISGFTTRHLNTSPKVHFLYTFINPEKVTKLHKSLNTSGIQRTFAKLYTVFSSPEKIK
jgi:hypothetical protein